MASFLLVVVVYKKELNASQTLCSIARCARDLDSEDYRVFVYDNSPSPHPLPVGFPIKIEYFHDPANPGLATAYNAALERAGEVPWLVLLDDDTELTTEYLHELRLVSRDSGVDVFVPHIVSGDWQISPHRVRFAHQSPVVHDMSGLMDFEVNAINSGTAIRVRSFARIGSFNRSFPLDFLDYWLFYQFHTHGLRVYIGRSSLQHDLSVLDYSRVSFARYRSIVASEHRFVMGYKGRTEQCAYRFRLLLRAVKQWIRLSDKRLAGETLRYLFGRSFDL